MVVRNKEAAGPEGGISLCSLQLHDRKSLSGKTTCVCLEQHKTRGKYIWNTWKISFGNYPKFWQSNTNCQNLSDADQLHGSSTVCTITFIRPRPLVWYLTCLIFEENWNLAFEIWGKSLVCCHINTNIVDEMRKPERILKSKKCQNVVSWNSFYTVNVCLFSSSDYFNTLYSHKVESGLLDGFFFVEIFHLLSKRLLYSEEHQANSVLQAGPSHRSC